MKKTTLGLLCVLAVSAKVSAADLSLGLGADYWYPTPTGQIQGVGSNYDDPSLWTYWVGIGGGLDIRQLDGDFNGKSYKDTIPMAYLQADANIPGTTVSGFADARVSSWDGNHSHDYRIGMAMELVAKFKLRAGYRNVRMDDEMDGVEFAQRMDGWFAGAEYRF